MLKNLLLVGIGGGTGACLRYAISLMVPTNSIGFPTPTFIANLLGCLLLGFLTGYLLKFSWPVQVEGMHLLIGVGLLGGFTTFSTFSLESIKMLQSGNNMTFWIYVLSTNILGIALGFIGIKLASI